MIFIFEKKTDQDLDVQAEGRLAKLDLTLLNNKNKSIYKPLTQDFLPYTEDNQDEYLNAYSGLSIEQEDQFLIGKNILLISDMEAFKAANPESCFEDFIHWYSPKDFLDANYDEHGQLLTRECLSERFQLSDCLWRKIWQSAGAVPFARQKRIFNYSMEAERVLEYLSAIKYENLIEHLFSTFVLIGCSKYRQLIENCKFKSTELSVDFDQQMRLIGDQCKTSNQEATITLLLDLEAKLFNRLSLIYLFKQLEDEAKVKELIGELTKNRFFKIRKDEFGSIVFNELSRLFNLANQENLKQLKRSEIRKWKEKEFTFVADCARPASYSRKIPQKLHFTVRSNDENRKFKIQMNGQFAEDIVYF